MSKKMVIVSGGDLDEKLTLSYLREEENYIIGVDKGMEFLYNHDISPDYIVGDFDSADKRVADYYRNETDIPVREFNPVKDASDTEIAVRLAMALGGKELIILGATGGRLDHLWANVQILTIPHEAGVEAVIVDRQNKIRLISGETHLRKEDAYGSYFSVFPLGETIYGFTIKGAKYPLSNHELTPCDSLCVSNQIEDDEAVIDFRRGTVILMETCDRKDKV